MGALLQKKVPLAWLVAVVVMCAGAALYVWVTILDAEPSGAVLIERVTPVATVAAQLVHATPTSSTIGVYVSGAVLRPGVYELPAGARLEDALRAAGGALPEADLDSINLAARLTEEEHVLVPNKASAGSGAGGRQLATSAPFAPSGMTPSPRPPGSKLNINTATVDELDTLPGVGAVIASRIVAYREANGPFKSVDALTDVQGIGDATLAKLRDLVTTGP